MKQSILIMLAGALVMMIACKKTNSSSASVLFYNGSWSSSAISAAWNGSNLTSVAVAQGQSSGTPVLPYLQAPAGTNLVTLRSGTDVLVDKNIYTAAATATSFLFYDTTATAVTGAKLNILQLTDNLSLPDTASLKYRFIDVAPGAGEMVDIWLVNAATDSVRLDSAAAFIGVAAEASAVQAFTVLKYHGESYTIKIKKSGTELLYASIPNYGFTVKGIYSIIFSGLLAGTGDNGFKLTVLNHRAT